MAEDEKGMSVFLDVFRRADKNDDNALSLNEFKSFFNDGVLTSQQLEDLFHEIDTHNTSNIDTGELCAYFSQHLGAFKGVFSALASLNDSVNQAVNDTAQSYANSNAKDQFATRFLLREVINQFEALKSPVEAASDHLDMAAVRDRASDIGSQDSSSTKTSTIVPGRIARRARQQLSTQTSVPMDSMALSVQVDRLREMIDKLENKVNLSNVSDEQLNITEEHLMMLVRRKLQVQESCNKAFTSSLRNYVEALNATEECHHVQVRSYSGSNLFVVYEVWDSEQAWKGHLGSVSSKSFSHSNIDNLERPEDCTSMPVPGSWWQH